VQNPEKGADITADAAGASTTSEPFKEDADAEDIDDGDVVGFR
jgi:hypothetical protein